MPGTEISKKQMIIERMRLIWYALRRPIIDKNTLLREIGEIGHHVTQLHPQDIEKDPWPVRQLRTLLYQAVLQNIWDKTVAWGLRIWAEAENGNTTEKNDFPRKKIITGIVLSASEAIQKRQSMRSFDEKPIPGETIKFILESAIEAPCSCNRQTWRFLVLTGRDDIKYFAEVRRSKWIQKAGTVILVFSDLSRYHESGCERQYTPYLDTGAAIENMLIAATASGVASCWVNCGAYEIDEDVRQEVYQKFYLPEDLLWTGIVVLGYAVKRFPKPPRRPLEHYLLKDSKGCLAEKNMR